MNKKRISLVAIVLTLCMFFGQINPVVVQATTTEPTITVSDVEGNIGDTVKVNITVSNNPGLIMAVLGISYDSNLMTLTGIEDGGILGSSVHDTESFSNPYYMSWQNGTAKQDYTANGVIATLTFKLTENIESTQKCDLTLSYDYDNYEIVNQKQDPVKFNLVKGTATIKVPPKPVEGISLDKTTLDMKSGTTETLAATITPSNATNQNITWKSSNEAVATVKDGVVTAVTKGNATITVTTEDGAKTATCAVNVTCSHPSTTLHEEVSATCTKEGHEEYTICNTCNEVIDGEDKAIPMLPHTLTAHKRVEPTHTTNGNIAFWTCDVCEKFFSDDAGKTEIKETDTILSKDPNAHDYTGQWVTDADKHWKVCGCNQLVSEGKHEYDNTCDTTCNVCGRERTIEHTWSKSYSHNEGRHWIECSVCHVEKDGTNEEHAVGTAGTNATCQVAATCGTCKQSFGTTIMHDYSKEVIADKYLDQKATCVSVAVYRKSCTMCGQAGMDKFNGTTVDKNNHTGNTELRGQLNETCVNEGYTGDTHCKDCGALLVKGEVIAKVPHVIEWTVTKEATAQAKGEKTGTCTGCDNKFTVETDKLVSELKKENNEGNLEAEVKSENQDLPAESIFVADEVTNEILPDDKKDVQDAVKEAVKKVKNVTEKHKIASILDLKIVVRDKTDDGNYVETEHDLKGKVIVTVEIPKNVLELFENIVLLHIKDDGSVEEVPFSMSGKDKATFATDGFSYYVFAGTEKVAQNPPATDTSAPAPAPQPTAAKTGDNSSIMVWTLLMLVACASVVTVVIKKRRYNR